MLVVIFRSFFDGPEGPPSAIKTHQNGLRNGIDFHRDFGVDFDPSREPVELPKIGAKSEAKIDRFWSQRGGDPTRKGQIQAPGAQISAQGPPGRQNPAQEPPRPLLESMPNTSTKKTLKKIAQERPRPSKPLPKPSPNPPKILPKSMSQKTCKF